jgi:hypothetical protein
MSEKISAICLSYPSRRGLLQRAIYSFVGQDYKDRELLVGIHDEEYFEQMSSWLADSRHVDVDLSSVRVLQTEHSHIGQQVVEVFKESSGEYIAVWCDDNLSHRQRLSVQKEESSKYATVVSTSFYYFYDTNELFVTDFHQPGRTLVEKCAVGSLLVRRDQFSCASLLGSPEDAHWPSVLVRALANNFPSQLYRHLRDADHGFLFMQGVHGDNHRGDTYHRTLGTRLPLTWSREKVLSCSDTIDQVLDGYTFPQSIVEVAGRDAAACVISGENIHQWPDWFVSPVLSDVCE